MCDLVYKIKKFFIEQRHKHLKEQAFYYTIDHDLTIKEYDDMAMIIDEDYHKELQLPTVKGSRIV